MAAMDESYLRLAARYLRKQIKQLTGQIEGIRKAEDVEYVHRARVASRRLREGLDFFASCFPADSIKAWRKEVRRVGRELGDARDLDVQMEHLREVLGQLNDPAYVPGIARLLVRLERNREKLQPRVLEATGHLLASRALHQMLSATKRLLAGGKEIEESPSPALLEHAQTQILARLADLRSHESCLAEPESVERHHQMRIAAKKLRYTMEICRPFYAGRLDPTIAAVKQAQTLLGEIHDCDVWIEQLDAFEAKQSKRMLRLYRHSGPLVRLQVGLQYLRGDRQLHRAQQFQTLVDYWNQLLRDQTWEELERVARSRDVPPQPREAG